MTSGVKPWVIGAAAALWGIVLVSARDEPAEQSTQLAECRVRVTADVLNVRAGPGTDTPVVGRLERGEAVEARRRTEQGFRQLDDGRWVATRFLDRTRQADCAERQDTRDGPRGGNEPGSR